MTALTDGVYVEPGDFNEDGVDKKADLPLWKTGFGISAAAIPLQGDADGDGAVNGADMRIWQRHYGSRSATAAVPEPAAVCLDVGSNFVVLTPVCERRRTIRG
ncbi:MAG: hypothetical protein JNL18_08715 [Planctomycetaceae bacterium]|nr:hypothetical protein [Planctomycetaceae bacterium]